MRFDRLFAAAVVLFFSVSAIAAPVFPGKDWEKTTPKAQGWDESALKAWEDYVFSDAHVTDSVVLIQGGKLVYERYARGYTPEMRHMGWSTTKSLWTTVFGIAQGKGLISSSDRVTHFFPEKTGTAWEQVELRHLATMSSGIESDEGYQTSPFKSDIVAALYRAPYLSGKGTYRLKQRKRVAPPGERFAYASGETNLLSACMKSALGAAYATFPYDELLDPIGAKSFVLEKDQDEVFVASSYSYATPRDYARFGYLFLRGGNWNGKQLVPAEWVRYATTPGTPFSTLRLDHRPMEQYGAGWWLNQPVPTAQLGKAIQSAPADLFWAEGHEGQFIFVVPSLDLVAVRFGVDKEKTKRLDKDKFFRLLMPALPQSQQKGSR